MRLGRRLTAGLVAGLWLALASLGTAHEDGPIHDHPVEELPLAVQDAAPADPDLSSIPAVLEAATNLPQLLALNGAQRDPETLRDLVETERLRLIEILRNDGYLAADITLSWPDPAVADASTMQVRVAPGDRYRIGRFNLATAQPVPDAISHLLAETAATLTNEIGNAGTIGTLTTRLNWRLGQEGYPFSRFQSVDIQPIPDQQAAMVSLLIDTGRPAHFVGSNLDRVDAPLLSLVVPLIPFTEGDLYSVDAMAELRRQLSEIPGVTDYRADAAPAGEDGFRIDLRVKRGAALQPQTTEANLGFILLLSALGTLAARQALVSMGRGPAVIRTLSFATGGILALALTLLALRVLTYA